MKPIPMSAFIPPVTGVYGLASNVVANAFDVSGQFRNRMGSFKRRRANGGDSQSPFDLMRDFPPPVYPTPLTLDITSVRSLMVEAAKKTVEIEGLLGVKGISATNKTMATSIIGLYKLVEAVVERAIIPLSECNSAPTARGPPAEARDVAELRAALETADKTVIVFGADLGPVPLANRATLAANFTSGLRVAAIAKAGEDAVVAAEAVRTAADALSCAASVDFLGQSSRRPPLVAGEDAPPCSMPVRLTFEDRGGRLHFERTMREKCGVRASMSLPTGIRKALKSFHDAMKVKYPELIVMTRTDTKKMSFVLFTKRDGEKSWLLRDDTVPIDPACLASPLDDQRRSNTNSDSRMED